MDLREFVAEALSQIVDGVKEAQDRTQASGARVNPLLTINHEAAAKQGMLIAHGMAHAQLVQFDVALTAKEGTGTKGGIGVVVGAFTLGSTGQSQEESGSVSRVKFSVPLVLPNGPSG